MTQSTPNGYSTFSFNRSETIGSLGVDVSEFTHIKTGAKHYHIASEHDENVFLVAFKTVPTDSTGVAHVLEHTALCGSEKYPVRDPFFMMTRRSLNTFMNAFTSSDWTAYPFASQNNKDFFNLLDVYLDAAFFSRLDPLDFAQEGHRIEFSTAGDTDSPLEYKGVVYNEMKGAMSSPVSTLWQAMTKYLFPTTTYHYNSGGDPECITDLTYDQLIAFYKKHYHPSNAVFFTFGNLSPESLQEKFENQVLNRFEASEETIEVADEKPYHAPLRVQEYYALDQEDISGKTHHVIAWLLGHSTDLETQLKAHLLSRVLLDNSGSPLRYALESSSLGSAPSPLCGLEDSNRQMSFMCGIEGSEPECAADFEALVLDTLKKVAKEGIALETIEAQLHQLELGQREISGDGQPYGLNIIMGAVSPAIHGGDAIAAMDIDPVIARLREEIKDPAFISDLINDLLLENVHRLTLTLSPDTQLEARRNACDIKNLQALKDALSDDEKQAIVAQAQALEARQQSVDDDEILPKVTIADVPDSIFIPSPTVVKEGFPLTQYSEGTNGLVYQQVIVDLPYLSPEEQSLMPLYTYLITELGCAGRSYLENQQYQSAVSGGISAYTTMRGTIDDEQAVDGYLVLSGKALVPMADKLNQLLFDTLTTVQFSEHSRICEVVAQQAVRKEQSVTGNGHAMAMLAAVSKISPTAAYASRTRGLESIAFVKALNESLKSEGYAAELESKLVALHNKVLACPCRHLTVTEKEFADAYAQSVEQVWQAKSASNQPAEPFALAKTRDVCRQAWSTSSQVNFCAKAFKTVPVSHPDAAPLTVLGEFLRNGYLHRAIREQGGAYGSGAGQDSGDAVFRFFSYRDPRLTETLDDFDASVQWMIDNEHDAQRLEEAILGVISSLDKPGSPAGEAKQAFHSELFGRTPEQRRAFRASLLSVTIDDLKRVAATYLTTQDHSSAVVTNDQGLAQLDDTFERFSI